MLQLRAPLAALLGDAYEAQIACLNKANNSTQVIAIDKLINDLNTGWRPTGYYTPNELQSVIAALDDAADNVGRAIKDAPIPWFSPDAESMKKEAFNDILVKWRDRGVYFKTELAKARAAGASAINAPGVKDWAISSMRAMSDGYTTAAMLSCQTTRFQSVLEGGFNVLARVGQLLWSIAGAIADFAGDAWDATKDAGRFVRLLLKAAPFVVVGLGSYLAFVYGRAGYYRLIKRAEQPINWRLFQHKPKQITGRYR